MGFQEKMPKQEPKTTEDYKKGLQKVYSMLMKHDTDTEDVLSFICNLLQE